MMIPEQHKVLIFVHDCEHVNDCKFKDMKSDWMHNTRTYSKSHFKMHDGLSCQDFIAFFLISVPSSFQGEINS